MGMFNTAVITAKGQALLTKTLAGNCKVVFTRVALSEAQLTGDLSAIAELTGIKQSEPVSQLAIKNDTTVSCEVAFTNAGLQTGYYVRAIGLYANDPDEGEILYNISTADESVASADWMPPFTGKGVTSYIVDVVTTVANSSNVEVVVDPTALVTMAQLNNHGHKCAGYSIEPVSLTDLEMRGITNADAIHITENSIVFDKGGSCHLYYQGFAEIAISCSELPSSKKARISIDGVSAELTQGAFTWAGDIKEKIYILCPSSATITFQKFLGIKYTDGFMTGTQALLHERFSGGAGEKSVQQVLDAETWDTTNEKVKEYVKGSIAGANNGLTVKGNVVGDVVSIFVGAFGKLSSMLGGKSQAIGGKSHAEGSKCIALENNSHAEGNETFSAGAHSHAEGNGTSAIGSGSHSEGSNTLAEGEYSHAEGWITKATGKCAHSEGMLTEATGDYSHSEGYDTKAIGMQAHSEGWETEAQGYASHAQGGRTIAKDAYDFVTGFETVASGDYQSVFGRANAEDNTKLVIVGNGKINDDYSVKERSNAHTLDWDGNAWYAGSVEAPYFILKSSTAGSNKRFMITVDDSGNLKATEIN